LDECLTVIDIIPGKIQRRADFLNGLAFYLYLLDEITSDAKLPIKVKLQLSLEELF